jgi:hypothetical protein
LDEFLVIADPALIGRCMIGTHLGTLSKVGTGEVDGKPTVVIEDKGDVPGGAPGKAYIATKGEPLPLRVTQTGRRRPAGNRTGRARRAGTPATSPRAICA